MSKRKTYKKRQQHPAPWHMLLTPLEFELPILLDSNLTFSKAFEDCSAFGLTPSFKKLLAAADSSRSALLHFLENHSKTHNGLTPLHHHIQLKRRTALLYAAAGKELSSLVDRYLSPLNKLCALVDNRSIVESGNVVFGWTDAAPALNNRVELFDRYYKLIKPEYLQWSKEDDLYTMNHNSVHFERSNVLFLKGLLYYVKAAKHMHKLKVTESAKLLAETWHTLQQASGVFHYLRNSISSKSETLSAAVRTIAVHSPTLRVLANFVSMQQHYVALAVHISKNINQGRLANACTDFFPASQIVVEMAMSVDIHSSPQSKPIIEATKFMHALLRGLYFKFIATQQAAAKKYNMAEVGMDLCYRSFLPKLKVKLHIFEGGCDPLSYGIREEVDDSYSTTTRFREMGQESGKVERSGLQIIRQAMIQELAGHTTSVAAMANLLSKKVGQELTFERFDNAIGSIDPYTTRKMGTTKSSTPNTRKDKTVNAGALSPEIPRSVSFIEGKNVKDLLTTSVGTENTLLDKGQALPNMFADADAMKTGKTGTTSYYYKQSSYEDKSTRRREKTKNGVNWSSTKNGQQRVFFERILTNHEMAIRGEFVERKTVRPLSADLTTSSKTDVGTLFLPPKRDKTCAMCESKYSVLPGTVTLNSILTFRGERSNRPASYKYQAVQVCVFCLQFHYQDGGASETADKVAKAASQGGGNLLRSTGSSLPNVHNAVMQMSMMRSDGSSRLMNTQKNSASDLHQNILSKIKKMDLEKDRNTIRQMKKKKEAETHLKEEDDYKHLHAHVSLELLSAAHAQKNYRRHRRKSSLQINESDSMKNLLEEEEKWETSSGFTGELDKIDTQRVLTLTRVPKQALYTRGEKSSAGKVNELFYNMASQYQHDDEYDDWAADLEEYFAVNGELDSLRLFFVRVSTKPENQLNASNMTMEGVVNMCYLLDLLLDGPLSDWRVQNVMRGSKHVSQMLKSGIVASLRLNDATYANDITFHQFLAILKSANEPIYEEYGVPGSMSSLIEGKASQHLSTNSAELWALPGADRSALIAEEEEDQKKRDIRNFSEGVVGGSNHLRHIMHADAQYFRVRDLIRSMNVMMPGETQRMRIARHNKGKLESHVASIHKGVQQRENEKKKEEELRKLQRKAHEIGNLNLSSAERAKLAAEGGGVLNIHKRKCGLCTRLFSKPNLPTRATRGAIEDLRVAIAEKAEKRTLVAKFSGQRVEIPFYSNPKKERKGKAYDDERSVVTSEFVLVGAYDAGQEAFKVTHNDGSNRMHAWTKARNWKLFNRTKQQQQQMITTDPTLLALIRAEKEEKEKERLKLLAKLNKSSIPGGLKASKWGKMKSATNIFGGGVSQQKKTKEKEQEAFFIQNKKQEKLDEEKEALKKLAGLKAGGKLRRIANRAKAKTMRKYDGVRLCVFCTQFYEHAIFVESKKFIRPRAPQPKVPKFQSMKDLLADEQEEKRRIAEEEAKQREEEEGRDPVNIEHQKSVRRNIIRSTDCLPELGEVKITLPLVENEEVSTDNFESDNKVKSVLNNKMKLNREEKEEAEEGGEEEWETEEEKTESEQNMVNDLMTSIGLNLAKIGDIAYKRMAKAKLIDRLRYLAAIRVQSCARSFLVRVHWIKLYAKENNALKAGITEFIEKIDELKAKKRELRRKKRERKKAEKKARDLVNQPMY
jgi:hypothetical protein